MKETEYCSSKCGILHGYMYCALPEHHESVTPLDRCAEIMGPFQCELKPSHEGRCQFDKSSVEENVNHHESNREYCPACGTNWKIWKPFTCDDPWHDTATSRATTDWETSTNNVQLRKQLAKTASLLLRYLANDDRADALTHKAHEWLKSLGWDL